MNARSSLLIHTATRLVVFAVAAFENYISQCDFGKRNQYVLVFLTEWVTHLVVALVVLADLLRVPYAWKNIKYRRNSTKIQENWNGKMFISNRNPQLPWVLIPFRMLLNTQILLYCALLDMIFKSFSMFLKPAELELQKELKFRC